MSHEHHHSSGGSSSGGLSSEGLPPLMTFATSYWAVVGAAIGVASFANVANYVVYRQRLWAASKRTLDPAKPKSLLAGSYATITAIAREAGNASPPPVTVRNWHLRFPTFGKASLIVANIIIIVVLGFYGFDTRNRWAMEAIGYRTGFVAICQMPLIFLLSGKNNIIGYLTGMGYERLNWLHRWAARCLLFTTTIHMGYWFTAWAPYGKFLNRKIRTDPLTQRGLIAWFILLWIVFSSFAPIRGWRYEIFVAQHIASVAAFVGVVMIHTPNEVHIFLWIPIGLFFFDRLVRILRVLYLNLSIFHPKQRQAGTMNSTWACQAELTPLAPDHTRLTIRNPPVSWRPGQHVYLSCHSIVPLQSHPFSIASIPSDGKMEFVIRAHTGGTRRLFHAATKDHQESLPTADTEEPKDRSESQSDKSTVPVTIKTRMAAIEGPYGIMRRPEQFDSIVLFAGSTGATFCVPIIRDVVRRWSAMHAPSSDSYKLLSLSAPDVAATRRIRFIWAVKSRHQLAWFCNQLCDAVSEVESLRGKGMDVELDISVCCTCDDEYVGEHRNFLRSLGHVKVADKARGEVKTAERAPADTAVDEKSPLKAEGASSGASPVQVREVDPSTSSDSDGNAPGCGPSGCCCRAPTDGNTPTDFVCTCGMPPSDGDHGPTATPAPADSTGRPTLTRSTTSPSLHPSVTLATGRPTPEPIVRAVLERARGETAVLACGPRRMMDAVRATTVALSDERAVHKGTGAQGIWYYGEGFGW